MNVRNPYPKARSYQDARGGTRWRVSAHGKRVELGADWGSEEFARRYAEALEGKKPGMIGAERVKPKTVNDMVARFYRGKVYKAWGPSTRKTNRAIIEKWREEYGTYSVTTLKKVNIENMMADRHETPSAANNLLKRLRQLLDVAVSHKWIGENPARQVGLYEITSEGIYTWTEADIADFYETHVSGSLAHDAMTLMLYTAAAKVDAVKLSKFNIKQTGNGPRIEYRRQKTRHRKAMTVSIPIHPDLAAVIARLENKETFLHTALGEARSASGLGNLMREWCDEAGLPRCTSHGLRKACARRLAEGGASAPQIAAWTGHKTLAEVQRYIEQANRETMADDGLEALLSRPNGEQTVANIVELFAASDDNQLENKEK